MQLFSLHSTIKQTIHLVSLLIFHCRGTGVAREIGNESCSLSPRRLWFGSVQWGSDHIVSPSDGCAVTHVKQIGVSGPWWSGHISTSSIPAGRNMWGLYRRGSIQFVLEWNSYCENPTCSKVSFRISLKALSEGLSLLLCLMRAHVACLLWLGVFNNLYGHVSQFSPTFVNARIMYLLIVSTNCLKKHGTWVHHSVYIL